ncbi:MAG: hypothetical protein ACR2JJ_08785 [Sphingomicrobium sp.]
MRFFVLAAVALLPAASIAAPPEASPVRPKALENLGHWRGDCPPTAAQHVAQQLKEHGHRPQLHRLVELPPANVYAAMVRQVGGCEAPLILTSDVESRTR